MKKKLVMATLCITLSAMALSGCGDDKETEKTETEKVVETETEAEETEEEETETEAEESEEEKDQDVDATAADATAADAEEETEATPADAEEETEATPADAEEETEATPADAEEETEATPADAEEETEATPADAEEETEATPADAEEETEATPADATIAEATPVEYTSPDGAFHLTLPDDSWEEIVIEEGTQLYLVSGEEAAIFVTHGLQAGLGEMMMIDQNPDTKEEFEEQVAAQDTGDYKAEVLEYTKEISDDLDVISAYIQYTSESQPSFYSISYLVTSENEAYVLSAASYADRAEADKLYEAVLSFEFELQELPATPADATEPDAVEIETEAEEETETEEVTEAETETEEVTEAETETEEETEAETETEEVTEAETETEEVTEAETETEEVTEAETETEEVTEAETETEEETEAETETEEVTEAETETEVGEKVVYEDDAFTMVLPDDTWKVEEKKGKFEFTSGDNSLTVESISLKSAETAIKDYPESIEEFEKENDGDVLKYQKESIGKWELVSACWKAEDEDNYSIVYYLKSDKVAYLLAGTAEDEESAEAVYAAALSFKSISK